jgi:hypothetical protein
LYKKLIFDKRWGFIFHLLLGVLSVLSKWILVAWFYAAFFWFVNKVLPTIRLRRSDWMIYLLMYFSGFEILTRILKTSPFIPYELGKYITFFILIVGLSIKKGFNTNGIIIVLLLLPGIFMAIPVIGDYKLIIFNVFGMINLGLGVSFFSSTKINFNQLKISLRILLLPLVSAVVYTILVTPSFDELEFKLGSITDTTGGFGANQVSTAFGLGMILVFIFWYRWEGFTGLPKWVDLIMVGVFLFQGLLTFSRGGIIGGIITIIVLIFLSIFIKNSKLVAAKRSSNFLYVLLAIPFIALTSIWVNDITGGTLLQRYQGESMGTLQGSKEKNLEHITTGRSTIFFEDIELFKEYPFFGVGVNQSRVYRKGTKDIVAHVEFSRLLSEHGLFGLIICVFLLVELFRKLFNIRGSEARMILFLMYLIGFYTTFHAATRTFLSPLMMSLSYLTIWIKREV